MGGRGLMKRQDGGRRGRGWAPASAHGVHTAQPQARVACCCPLAAGSAAHQTVCVCVCVCVCLCVCGGGGMSAGWRPAAACVCAPWHVQVWCPSDARDDTRLCWRCVVGRTQWRVPVTHSTQASECWTESCFVAVSKRTVTCRHACRGGAGLGGAGLLQACAHNWTAQ
jgi:hypothetical protein